MDLSYCCWKLSCTSKECEKNQWNLCWLFGGIWVFLIGLTDMRDYYMVHIFWWRREMFCSIYANWVAKVKHTA